jgi:hypothetical protein
MIICMAQQPVVSIEQEPGWPLGLLSSQWRTEYLPQMEPRFSGIPTRSLIAVPTKVLSVARWSSRYCFAPQNNIILLRCYTGQV